MNATTAAKVERINDNVMEHGTKVIGAYIVALIAFLTYSLLTGMSTAATAAILLPAVIIPTVLGIGVVIASIVIYHFTDKVLDPQ